MMVTILAISITEYNDSNDNHDRDDDGDDDDDDDATMIMTMMMVVVVMMMTIPTMITTIHGDSDVDGLTSLILPNALLCGVCHLLYRFAGCDAVQVMAILAVPPNPLLFILDAGEDGLQPQHYQGRFWENHNCR